MKRDTAYNENRLAHQEPVFPVSQWQMSNDLAFSDAMASFEEQEYTYAGEQAQNPVSDEERTAILEADLARGFAGMDRADRDALYQQGLAIINGGGGSGSGDRA